MKCEVRRIVSNEGQKPRILFDKLSLVQVFVVYKGHYQMKMHYYNKILR